MLRLAVSLDSPFSWPAARTIFPPMESAAIRRKFLDYFSAAPRSHREVPSSSLVPADDPTLLFTNAGMVQFKRVFQGLERRDYSPGATGPKRRPAGGQHHHPRHAGRGKRKLGRDEFVRLSEAGELLEIWNLVFMQYDLRADGSRSPLPAPSVDTGAGLERVAAVMQGVASNFDTDLFTPVIRRAVEVVGKPYDRGPGGASYRVLADHARAVAFLLADGVFPSNEGRGYVLRRILRRAVRHAWLLGRRAPTLVHLAHEVCELMGVAYPELLAKRQHIETVTRAEEERFFETIEGGLKRLDELKRVKVIPSADAVKLYDTYGFPIDLTQLIAAERRQTVDVAGFERELGKQRTRSQEALERSKGGPAVQRQRAGEWRVVKPKARQQWVGYDTTGADTDLLAFRQAGDSRERALAGNPFYGEPGGRATGTGRGEGAGGDHPEA